MSFSSLGLSEPLVRAVTEQGYHTPTPIQLKAIPAVLAGGDLLAGAQTGTGKTAGFVLPMLQQLSRPNAAPPGASASRRRPLRALILTPTRELAAQVEASVRVYGKHLNLTSTIVIGGVGMSPQTAALSRGVDILVATPGRLLDHHGERNVDFSHVEIFVLDEADRMLDMGFIHDIKRVLAALPKQRQNLLFSATFSDDIRALAAKLLHSPAMIDVAPRNATVDMIEQVVHPVDRDRKRELLSSLISRNDWHQVLVFTRTKHGANKLAEQLNDDGIRALAIHGARHRHRPAAARGQLRPAERSRRLRASDRPHGACRCRRRGGLARVRRRARVPARHREADQEGDPPGNDCRLRTGSRREAAADRPAQGPARAQWRQRRGRVDVSARWRATEPALAVGPRRGATGAPHDEPR